MFDNDFDQFFRDRFTNYGSEIPENMWERIQKKDKDDRLVIWFVSLMAVVILLAGYLIFKDGNKDGSYSKKGIRYSSNNAGAHVVGSHKLVDQQGSGAAPQPNTLNFGDTNKRLKKENVAVHKSQPLPFATQFVRGINDSGDNALIVKHYSNKNSYADGLKKQSVPKINALAQENSVNKTGAEQSATDDAEIKSSPEILNGSAPLHAVSQKDTSLKNKRPEKLPTEALASGKPTSNRERKEQ